MIMPSPGVKGFRDDLGGLVLTEGRINGPARAVEPLAARPAATIKRVEAGIDQVGAVTHIV